MDSIAFKETWALGGETPCAESQEVLLFNKSWDIVGLVCEYYECSKKDVEGEK